MNYVGFYPEDYSNGEGRRVTLFVSGCSHGCKGCHNQPAQNPKAGKPVDGFIISQILEALEEADGFTITGGDPLYKRNIEGVTTLLEVIKKTYPQKDIWMWTGYTYKDVEHLEVMRYVDVLIDGKYEQDLPPAPWRGSNNQEIIFLNKI